ncbi:MAG: hypothetical protein CM1200mP13_01090 [Candidatus Pelagibacterales bacterium]|nr:MAG: hypothetical protein CM1200mP13_01090 [Pelagibacterales bacterium]
MVKSIMKTINKKRFVIEMPMTIAKIQSSILSLLPIPPVLTEINVKFYQKLITLFQIKSLQLVI